MYYNRESGKKIKFSLHRKRVKLAIRSLNNARRSTWICGFLVHASLARRAGQACSMETERQGNEYEHWYF